MRGSAAMTARSSSRASATLASAGVPTRPSRQRSSETRSMPASAGWRGVGRPRCSTSEPKPALSRASVSVSATMSGSREPAQANPWRPSTTTRTPTPSTSADDSDSTSPPKTLTSVWWERAAYASTCSRGLASPASLRTRARRASSASTGSGTGGTAHGHLGHPHRRLPGRDGDALTVLPAGAGPGVEVGADGVDAEQRFRPVADEVGRPHRGGEAPVLDEVGLGHAEHEVAGGGVALPAAEGGAVQAVGRGGHDVVGIVVAGQQIGVGHADHGERLVRLPPAVAARLPTLLAGPEEIPHVVGEDAALDQGVVPGGVTLVVDGQRAPAPVEGSVVDQRHQRRGDLG